MGMFRITLFADIFLCRIIIAVHHRNGNQQHQNSAADLKRTDTDTQDLQQHTAGQRKYRNHGKHGDGSRPRNPSALLRTVSMSQVKINRQCAERIDQHQKSHNQLADFHT